MNTDIRPYAITYSEQFDHEVRAEALRILNSGIGIGLAPDDTLAHPRLHEILLCLCYMAFGGFVDYYDGDTEAASWCVTREHIMCDELANLETEIETRVGSRTLKAMQPDLEMAAMRAECAAITADTSEVRAQVQARRPQLPPGARVSLRGLAIMRRREQED